MSTFGLNSRVTVKPTGALSLPKDGLVQRIASNEAPLSTELVDAQGDQTRPVQPGR